MVDFVELETDVDGVKAVVTCEVQVLDEDDVIVNDATCESITAVEIVGAVVRASEVVSGLRLEEIPAVVFS